MIPGTSIVLLDGKEYVVPSLTLPQARALAEKIALVCSAAVVCANGDALDACVEVATAAMRRNYPELDGDKVAELLDIHNMMAVIKAAIGLSTITSGGSTFLMPSKGTLPN